MFLLGGTAFSGKTLLAHLLTQGSVVCLDEPDFHNIDQRHRGIPVLSTLFPEKVFPPTPDRNLTHGEAVTFIEKCEEIIRPATLGMKTAGRTFLEYATIYRTSGYPVVAVIRDIRDVLVEAPLPEWIDGEQALNTEFKAIWANLDLYDLCIRYEDLVTNPESILENISQLIAVDLAPRAHWSADSVHETMIKLDRHEMLRTGTISRERVGVWRTSGRTFSTDTQMTAVMMGYDQ